MMVIPIFCAPFSLPEDPSWVTSSPGFIAFGASYYLLIQCRQSTRHFWMLGFLKEKEFSSLNSLFPAKGRPVSQPCAWNVGPRLRKLHLSPLKQCLLQGSSVQSPDYSNAETVFLGSRYA